MEHQEPHVPFIRARDGKLWEGDREFRFLGLAVSNLHLNESQIYPDFSNRLPDEYELRDVLLSLNQMGCRATRMFSLSVYSPLDNGMPVYINGVGQYNEEAFRTFDKMLQIAAEYHIRLIIPFIDSHSFPGVRGVDDWTAWKNRPGTDFWIADDFKSEFQQLIFDVLHRRNFYTGILYKDDPTVLAWQLGNELDSYISDRQLDPQVWIPHLTNWSIEMARYIKSIDPNHLVMEAGGLRDVFLADPAIDIVSDHYYEYWSRLFGRPWNLTEQNRKSQQQAAGCKPLIADEFGLGTFANLASLIDEMIANGTCGGLLWGLRGHRRDGGFYYHNEGGTDVNSYHWPGFSSGSIYDEQPLLALVRKKAFEIQGLPEAPLLPPLDMPLWMEASSPHHLLWRGVTGASSYILERGTSLDGPWIVLANQIEDAVVRDVKSYEMSGYAAPLPLFDDLSALPGTVYFYRVRAQNSAGIGPWSDVLTVS